MVGLLYGRSQTYTMHNKTRPTMKVETGRSLCCLKVSVNPLRTAMIISAAAFILSLESNLIYDAGLFPTERNVVGRRRRPSSRPAFNGRSRFTLTNLNNIAVVPPLMRYKRPFLDWSTLFALPSLP